jgi:isopentenyl-diphosphate Delta-isomerase
MPPQKPGKKDLVHKEYVEIVDSQNQPLAVMDRDEAHRQGLFLRSVLVIVHDMQNRLLLQKRHPSKRVYPGRWDLSATGHVLAGESALDAAYRELEEEMGIEAPRMKLAAFINAGPETDFRFVYLFNAGKMSIVPGPDSGEVEDITFIDRQDLHSLVKEFPDILTPGLVYMWKRQLLF